jgi:hypothetical protein
VSDARSQGCPVESPKLVCAPRCRHPSIRTLQERVLRSVQVGCSRFSRCCHLIVDLSSISRWKLGQAIDAVTGTRRWGAVLPIRESELGCRQHGAVAIAQRFVSSLCRFGFCANMVRCKSEKS